MVAGTAVDMDAKPQQEGAAGQSGQYGDWHAQGRDRSDQVKAAASRKRLVSLLKVVFPGAALGLIAVMFLWPEFYGDEEAVPLTFTDVGTIDDDLRMISPRFVGSDDDAQPFTITADSAVQDQGDPTRILLSELQADITLSDSDGAWLSLSAAEGLYLVNDQTLSLQGRVSIFSDIGYELHVEKADIDLKLGTIASDVPIAGQGPLGEIEAGGMTVSGNGDHLRFINGVRLTLYPEGN